MQVVVLASGSQYRAQLLARLNLSFQTLSPDIDESVQKNELPEALAERLAREKAHRVAQMMDGDTAFAAPPNAHEGRIIIGSDQVACAENHILGKPGTHEKACAQLAAMSGSTVRFFTALHMLDTVSGTHFCALDITLAKLRSLDTETIARYVAADQPLDCAGSFKVESLGISLFESVNSDDPTALIGLPMISVCNGLRHFGMNIP